MSTIATSNEALIVKAAKPIEFRPFMQPKMTSGAFPFIPGQTPSYTVIANPQPTTSALIQAAKAGKPLQRSSAIKAAAARAARNRGKKPKDIDAWADRLATDFIAPND